MSKVYFLELVSADSYTEIISKLDKLFAASSFSSTLVKNGLTAIKTHFGEKGNKAFLKPLLIKKIISKIKGYNAKVFLTDTNTLYKGTRTNTFDHLQTAYYHGFTLENVGAPIIMADGFNGQDFVNIEVNLKHFKEVKIGAAVFHASSLVAVTHFKGHELTGFGGAIKNISMGLASRGGKQAMHSEVLPKVTINLCNGCALCLRWCPEEAIKMIKLNPAKKEKYAEIIAEKCIGCGECVVTCPTGAIAISWRGSPSSVQEKMAEYALGALKDKKNKSYFLNFLIDISPNCDCYGFNDPPIVKDIGALASFDAVAIDQASLDLVNKTAGDNIFKKLYPEIEGTIQLNYGKQIGLGSKTYELIKV